MQANPLTGSVLVLYGEAQLAGLFAAIEPALEAADLDVNLVGEVDVEVLRELVLSGRGSPAESKGGRARLSEVEMHQLAEQVRANYRAVDRRVAELAGVDLKMMVRPCRSSAHRV